MISLDILRKELARPHIPPTERADLLFIIDHTVNPPKEETWKYVQELRNARNRQAGRRCNRKDKRVVRRAAPTCGVAIGERLLFDGDVLRVTSVPVRHEMNPNAWTFDTYNETTGEHVPSGCPTEDSFTWPRAPGAAPVVQAGACPSCGCSTERAAPSGAAPVDSAYAAAYDLIDVLDEQLVLLEARMPTECVARIRSAIEACVKILDPS